MPRLSDEDDSFGRDEFDMYDEFGNYIGECEDYSDNDNATNATTRVANKLNDSGRAFAPTGAKHVCSRYCII